MSITTIRVPTTGNDREQLACDLVESHVTRVVVCTPSKIVFETKSIGDAAIANTRLLEHGYSTELYDGRFLHARF